MPYPFMALFATGGLVKNIARGFRLWGKKRGDRRTGSHLVASFGEGIFFGVLFLLGSISLTVLVTVHVVDPATEVFRIGFGFWLLMLVLASFILLGGGGMCYTALQAGVSAERRSALARRAATIDLIGNALPSAQDYPSVPRDGQLTDSPGVTLACHHFALPGTVRLCHGARRGGATKCDSARHGLLPDGVCDAIHCRQRLVDLLFSPTTLGLRPDWTYVCGNLGLAFASWA